MSLRDKIKISLIKMWFLTILIARLIDNWHVAKFVYIFPEISKKLVYKIQSIWEDEFLNYTSAKDVWISIRFILTSEKWYL